MKTGAAKNKAETTGHLKIVRLFLEAGADKDKVRNTGASPFTLHLRVVNSRLCVCF